MLTSENSCAHIISHISAEMVKEIVAHIVTNEFDYSIMVDESTSESNVQSLIVYRH